MQLEFTLVYNLFPAAEIEFNLVEDHLHHAEHRLDQVSSIGQVRKMPRPTDEGYAVDVLLAIFSQVRGIWLTERYQ